MVGVRKMEMTKFGVNLTIPTKKGTSEEVPLERK
jgi:hypothetical protein